MSGSLGRPCMNSLSRSLGAEPSSSPLPPWTLSARIAPRPRLPFPGVLPPQTSGPTPRRSSLPPRTSPSWIPRIAGAPSPAPAGPKRTPVLQFSNSPPRQLPPHTPPTPSRTTPFTSSGPGVQRGAPDRRSGPRRPPRSTRVSGSGCTGPREVEAGLSTTLGPKAPRCVCPSRAPGLRAGRPAS